MSISLSVPENQHDTELKPRITVVGVGGAGGNAVNNMIKRELEGVDFVVANTDAQALLQSTSQRRIQLGATLTEGLGAGSKPEIGAAAAEEARDEMLEQINGAHMAFIAAGMGGGTGTGAAPVIAQAAKEAGILTVAVVTKPFQFEGSHRMRLAESGIEELAKYVDTLIIIPNQNLFRVATENTTFADAFGMADEVLYSGVRGVTDLMVMPGLINLDFADIRSVMSEMGKAMMGTGEAEGDRRALEAAESAIANPLLDDTSMKGAKGVLINITGGSDITLFEVDEAASRIRSEVDQDAYIIIGSAFDAALDGKMRVSVVATGIDAKDSTLNQPRMMQVTEAISRVRNEHKIASPSVPLEIHGGAAAEPIQTGLREGDTAEVHAQASATFYAESGVTQTHELEDDEGQNYLEPKAIKPVDLLKEVPILQETIKSPTEMLQLKNTEVSQITTEASVEDPLVPIAPQSVTPSEDDVPAAMPRLNGEDAYIPPVPHSAEDTLESTKPEPFAAAAMANGAYEGTGTDAGLAHPTLFERVTRTGRAALSRPTRDENESVEVFDTGKLEISRNNPGLASDSFALNTTPLDATPSELISPEGGHSTLKGGIEATALESGQSVVAEMIPVESSLTDETDLLDIPAFLRRQAN
ncbi:MAG: cell division protein FtsZ [Rhodospirillaceae bacterium TMED8]|nr:cell division protein FtsZ [Magnetovibrio sp.]OUT52305.1 MAG: cell division protein FtsZ [Rhodospirillaceae bacterium TMED8]